MGTLLQDLKYGLRMLLKNPGFTIVAVLTLALGIGANTAIFSVINAELLQPLPYHNPGTLVRVWTMFTHGQLSRFSTSYPDFADWRAQNHVFERIAAYYSDSSTLTGVEKPAHLTALVSSWDLFELLGAKPEIGRTFLPEEDSPHHRVVVLSDHVWRERFGANLSILTQTVTLNGDAYTVVGVMPARFHFPLDRDLADVYLTFSKLEESTDGTPPETEQRGAHFLGVIARLKPGVTVAQADADMSVVAGVLQKQYPDTDKHEAAIVVPLQGDLTSDVRPALSVLAVAVGLVLLIACVNVANLLLARATTRGREIAIRTALGAERKRVVRQLLTESLVLSFLAGIAGLIFAVWGSALLTRLSPERLLHFAAIHLDGWVLAFALVISILTGALFGLAPALQASRGNIVDTLKESALNATAGRGRHRLRQSLVVVEMALALVLVVSAMLLIRSLQHLEDVKPGFDPRGVMTSNIDLPDKYTNEKQGEFYRELMARLNVLPGVESAAGIMPLPMSGNGMNIALTIEGKPVAPSEEPDTSLRIATPKYFQTMRIPELEGRDFNDHDDLTSLPVVIVNQAFAETFFPGEDSVGKHIKPEISVDSSGAKMREIVGVVGNVKFQDLKTGWNPEIYIPASQTPFGALTIVARTAGDPHALAGPIAETVRSVDPDLPAYRPKTVEEYLDGTIQFPLFNTMLLSVFAGLALLLTAVGLFGVISYSVAQRTHEIGVRMALGARPEDMLGLILGEGLRLAVVGVGLGLVAALALTHFLASLLFGVTATDPFSFVTVIGLLVAVVLLASYLPARRAMRIDPMAALRYE